MLDGVGRCTGASIIILISRVVLTGHSVVILNFIDRLINNRINMVCTTDSTLWASLLSLVMF
jgi:hypothetical protein